jgi:hypothetical protein
VGKTCSDQFLPEYYVETTDSSLKDTESFITYCREKWPSEAGLVKPVVTPRFVCRVNDRGDCDADPVERSRLALPSS